MLINDYVSGYIDKLIHAFPTIKSIWLFGSRANKCFNAQSDWDLLVFSDEQTFEQIKTAKSHKDDVIDLFVVYNEDSFEEPWPDISKGTKSGKLSGLFSFEWKKVSESEATYTGRKDLSGGIVKKETLMALKVWP